MQAQMDKKFSKYIIIGVAAAVMAGCSATRDIPEGSYMLDKVKVVADGKYQDVDTRQLKNYVRQKGNARWFSAIKLPLGVYAMAGRDSSWLNRTLRQMGEAPVIYDTLQAEMTCRDLQQALQNKGYLDAQVELYLDRKSTKKVDAVYVLHPGKAYYLRELEFEIHRTRMYHLKSLC